MLINKSINSCHEVDDPNELIKECMMLIENKREPLQEGLFTMLTGSAALVGGAVAFTHIAGATNATANLIRETFNVSMGELDWARYSHKDLQQMYLAKFPWLNELPPKERESKLKAIIQKSFEMYWNTGNSKFSKYVYEEQYTPEELAAIRKNMSFHEKLMELAHKLFNKMSSSLFYGVAALFVFAAGCITIIALCNGRFGRFLKLLSDLVAEFINTLKKIAYSLIHSVITVNPNMFGEVFEIFDNFSDRAMEIFSTVKEEGYLSSVITACVTCLLVAILGVFGLISFIMDNRNNDSAKYIAGGFGQ